MRELTEEIKLEKNKAHTLEAVIDRIIIKEGIEQRLADPLETAVRMGEGIAVVAVGEEDLIFSEHFACVDCGISLEEIHPRTFSFNSPYGAGPHCSGLGFIMEVDPDLVIPDPALSLGPKAVAWSRGAHYYPQILRWSPITAVSAWILR